MKETPSVFQTESYLEKIELPICDFYSMYKEEKLYAAIKYAKDLKDRYTVLWLYNDIEIG